MNEYKHRILNELRMYKNFDKKADFARFLGISPQTLSNWFDRCTFDINIIVDKFPEVDRVWLLTGEGEMLKKSPEEEKIEKKSNETVEMSREVFEMMSRMTETMLSQQRTIEKYAGKAAPEVDDVKCADAM